MHFFPTLWWPPFAVNRVLPEAVAEKLLRQVQPWRTPSGNAPKFPAHYRWCYGPTQRQLTRLRSVGFRVEHCVAYFGDGYVGDILHGPGRAVNEAWIRTMLRRPNYWLTSYAGYTLCAV